MGEPRDLVPHLAHRDALGEVVRADAIGRVLDHPHRAQHELAQGITHRDAGQQGQREQHQEDLAIAVHHIAHRVHRRAHRDLEGRELEFTDAQAAHAFDVGGVGALARDVGDRLATQIVRAEEAVAHRPVHVDVEQARGRFGGLANAVFDGRRGQVLVVLAERGDEVFELRLVDRIELPDQVLLQQVVPGHEQTGQGDRGREHVPQRDAPADRIHTSW